MPQSIICQSELINQSQPNPSGTDLSKCTWAPLQTHLYEQSWEQVMTAYMLRFPRHPRLPVLLGAEIIEDRLDRAAGRRRIVRQCTIDIEAPGCVF